MVARCSAAFTLLFACSSRGGALSSAPEQNNVSAPEQIHVSLGPDASALTVSWAVERNRTATAAIATAASGSAHCVRFARDLDVGGAALLKDDGGAADDAADGAALWKGDGGAADDATAATAAAAAFFASGGGALAATRASCATHALSTDASYTSPCLRHARLRGLATGGATYYYQIGDAAAGENTSAVFSVRTAPPPGASTFGGSSGGGGDDDAGDQPLTFAVLGDMGQTAHSDATCAQLAAAARPRARGGAGLAFAVLVGDVSYADGELARWDRWGRRMEACYASLPLMTLPGNHEIEFDPATRLAFAAYRARFTMPPDRDDDGGDGDGDDDDAAAAAAGAGADGLVDAGAVAVGAVRSWDDYDFNLTCVASQCVSAATVELRPDVEFSHTSHV